MSNNINEQLLEEAADLIYIWTGTTPGKMLERAVDTNDLERVRELVIELRSMAYEPKLEPPSRPGIWLEPTELEQGDIF